MFKIRNKKCFYFLQTFKKMCTINDKTISGRPPALRSSAVRKTQHFSGNIQLCGLQIQQPNSKRMAEHVRPCQDVPPLSQLLELRNTFCYQNCSQSRRGSCLQNQLYQVYTTKKTSKSFFFVFIFQSILILIFTDGWYFVTCQHFATRCHITTRHKFLARLSSRRFLKHFANSSWTNVTARGTRCRRRNVS